MRLTLIPIVFIAFLTLALVVGAAVVKFPALGGLLCIAMLTVGIHAVVKWQPQQPVTETGGEADTHRFDPLHSTPTIHARGPHNPPQALRDLVATCPGDLGIPTPIQTANGRVWLDIAKAPHALVAGATGSGKSVFLNTLLATATTARTPLELNVALIDPKRVELRRYANLPHVFAHATEKPEAYRVLSRIADTMDQRYEWMERDGHKDAAGRYYRVLVVIDEFADLVIPHNKTTAEKQLSEDLNAVIARLVALGRAAGIHVVLATQTPRANVITGLIKGNVPMRIAFRTSNKTESRIILDANGAEALPGKGRGLILTPQVTNHDKPGTPVEFQGLMVSERVLQAHTASA